MFDGEAKTAQFHLRVNEADKQSTNKVDGKFSSSDCTLKALFSSSVVLLDDTVLLY